MKLVSKVLALVLGAVLLAGVAAPATAEEVEAEQRIGWGALAKLHALASVKGVPAEELLDAVPFVNGDRDFGFGELKRDLTAEQRAELRAQARAFRELLKSAQTGEEDDGAEGAAAKAALLADGLGLDLDQVLEMRDMGVGWGAMFKLARLAAAKGIDPAALLLDEAGGLAFGKLKKGLTPEELAVFEDGPKNFGHLMRDEKRPPHAGPKDKDDKGKDKVEKQD